MIRKGDDRQVVFGGLALCVALLLLSAVLEGPTEEDAVQARYCDMVALYMDDPATGWPDYLGTYRQECPQARAGQGGQVGGHGRP